ncbi:LpxL/LpxP family Kdo(2)-lipid IV(A) lauroyl/palmitoleoyl acyltransferase [Edwardsiella tarda]|uniref:LpxL/LpxP family Kdo(2)-lipid IV(A) lauroyl/palmitoleoyl acyltransferase n=1 Tax=Edwardsiella tarda TaxID=636 RepID=UPI0024452C28|nr:LpxL/LpxP family Kdo(2)-lipid IV(A) lauroyl/palmitoleoyl acyltransferase [Edwardsiella tarda]WGE29582.1 LpxL/LpxP family Kdo(2)-lipid IV(A) lauroyl/palmitoleoyl acyltransferase [Edwardsiella tarda]
MKKTFHFRREFLHPRYFMLWLGIGLLYLLVQMPYRWICGLGRLLGLCAMRLMARRASIARQNLTLCFPEKSPEQIAHIVRENFKSLGISLFELGIAWFWSDRRIRRWFNVSGLEHMQAARQKGKGVLVVGVHFMSLDLGGRVMGLCNPMMAVYRPHNNPVLEYLQTRGRSRGNKQMLDRKNLKGIVGALKSGEAVWFAPDQDYGPRGSSFAPFFAVSSAATTNGTATLARLSNAVMLTTVLIRKPGAQGYQLIIEPELDGYPAHDMVQAATFMNRIVEREILRAPEQYLWLHRRFKTRPEGMPSLYTR